jgi:hypothetical protein
MVVRLPYFLEEVYNQKRLHSALGYRQPNRFAEALLNQENWREPPPDSHNSTYRVIGVQFRETKRYDAMTLTIIAITALVFSITSFYISFVQSRRMESTRRRLEIAMFDIQRDAIFEAKLAEWPNVLRFHGINIEAAERDGITAQDITYLILSIDGLAAYCSALGIKIYDHLENSDYRQRMFAQSDTRKAWKYARLCIPAIQRADIDRFVKKKYGEDYDSV